MTRQNIVLSCIAVLGFLSTAVFAQDEERPYFVTYDHHMEGKDELEIGANAVLGRSEGINTFLGQWLEFEYGAMTRWTTEFYVDWQHTRHEGAVFTGVRWENRFRLSTNEHKINPVLYIEYEHLNGADKIIKEVVGFDGKDDFKVPNSVARKESEREMEAKLILSSEINGWNVAENFIGVKDIHGGPWEFGYAVGVSRPLKLSAGASRCAFCRESFTVGAELYGGLGTWHDFTFHGTSQYLAPLLRWTLPSETTFRISPGWGLTDQSVGSLIRFGVSQEIDGFGRRIGKLFRRH